jgi:hypothetical protein
VVFWGNQVKNQDFEQATFMDLGNSSATIESARLCDFYGCLRGHDVSVADAVQAYIQAELGEMHVGYHYPTKHILYMRIVLECSSYNMKFTSTMWQ